MFNALPILHTVGLVADVDYVVCDDCIHMAIYVDCNGILHMLRKAHRWATVTIDTNHIIHIVRK